MYSSGFVKPVWMSALSWDVVPIAIVGAAATAGGINCVYDFWKFFRNRRRVSIRANTDHGRMVSEEARNGWRLTLPAESIIGDYWSIDYPLPSLGFAKIDQSGVFDFESGVVIRGVGRLPDGRKCAILVRHSLLWPEKIKAAISKIIYNDFEWAHEGTYYLTKDTLASIYRKDSSSSIRIITTDVCGRRPHRVFDLAVPSSGAEHVLLIYGGDASKRLSAFFGGWTEDAIHEGDDPTMRFEVWTAEYDVSVSAETGISMYQPLRNESIAFPAGARECFLWLPISDREMTVLLYNDNNPEHMEGHLCMTFSESGRCRLENLKAMRSYRKEKFWESFVHSVESFRALKPPEGWCKREVPIPLFRYWSSFEPSFNANHGMTKEGLFTRWMSPASLEFSAAKALIDRFESCSKPIQRSEMKDALGVDVFQGYPEGKDDDAVNIIVYLSQTTPQDGPGDW